MADKKPLKLDSGRQKEFASSDTISDEVVGNRTVSDTDAPTGDSGLLSILFGWLANRIKSITGKASWRDAPSVTLETTNTHINSTTNPHSVTKTQVGLGNVVNALQWHAGNDGSGSGLDADLLDGNEASAFLPNTEVAKAANTYLRRNTDNTAYEAKTPAEVLTDIGAAAAVEYTNIVQHQYTATDGQTVFTGVDDNGLTLAYTAGYELVFLNGIKLEAEDYIHTNSSTITLNEGTAIGDVLVVIVFSPLVIADTYTQAQTDSTFVKLAELLTQVKNVDGSGSGLDADLLDGNEASAFLLNAEVPKTADTYLRRNAANTGHDAKTPLQVADELIAVRDWRGRNVLINGDMRVWQEGTSFTGRIASSIYTADQFMFGVTSSGTWTVQQVADHPVLGANGFCMEALVTTADGTVNSTDWCQITAKVEGYSYAHLRGKAQTISFGVKSNVTGIYSVNLKNDGSTESYVTEITINSPDTWEIKTITVTGTPAGTWNFTNGLGVGVGLSLVSGSNFHSSQLNTWVTENKLASANQVNLAASVGNYIRITDIQLESGSVATPFERRPIQQELALCQRYFELVQFVGAQDASNGTLYGGSANFRQVKRTVPTMSLADTFKHINSSESRSVSSVGVVNQYGFYAVYASSAGTSGFIYRGLFSANARL